MTHFMQSRALVPIMNVMHSLKQSLPETVRSGVKTRYVQSLFLCPQALIGNVCIALEESETFCKTCKHIVYTE